MFMLKSTMELIEKKEVEIAKLKSDKHYLDCRLDELESKLSKADERATWEVEQIKNTVKKDMQKKLIESDLKRVEAVAKLNTYIDMDTKDERKKISGMLEEAIKSLGKQKVTINNKE